MMPPRIPIISDRIRGYTDSVGNFFDNLSTSPVIELAPPTTASLAKYWAAGLMGNEPDEIHPSISDFLYRVTTPDNEAVIAQHLEKGGITQDEFEDYMVNAGKGMQRAYERFGHDIPEIRLTDGNRVCFNGTNINRPDLTDSPEYEAEVTKGDNKIEFGVKHVADWIARTRDGSFIHTMHTGSIPLTSELAAQVAGFEEATHAYTYRVDTEKGLLVHNSTSLKRFGKTNSDFYHSDSDETFAGFHIRDDIRENWTLGPANTESSYLQDLLLVKSWQDGKLGHFVDYMHDLLVQKHAELTAVTSEGGELHGTKTGKFIAENLRPEIPVKPEVKPQTVAEYQAARSKAIKANVAAEEAAVNGFFGLGATAGGIQMTKEGVAEGNNWKTTAGVVTTAGSLRTLATGKGGGVMAVITSGIAGGFEAHDIYKQLHELANKKDYAAIDKKFQEIGIPRSDNLDDDIKRAVVLKGATKGLNTGVGGVTFGMVPDATLLVRGDANGLASGAAVTRILDANGDKKQIAAELENQGIDGIISPNAPTAVIVPVVSTAATVNAVGATLRDTKEAISDVAGSALESIPGFKKWADNANVPTLPRGIEESVKSTKTLSDGKPDIAAYKHLMDVGGAVAKDADVDIGKLEKEIEAKRNKVYAEPKSSWWGRTFGNQHERDLNKVDNARFEFWEFKKRYEQWQTERGTPSAPQIASPSDFKKDPRVTDAAASLSGNQVTVKGEESKGKQGIENSKLALDSKGVQLKAYDSHIPNMPLVSADRSTQETSKHV